MKKLLMVVVLGLATMQVVNALPRGNYMQTCRRCYMRRSTLYCKCQRANGRWDWSQTFVGERCGFIQNINGNLECTGGRPGPRPRPRPRPNNNNPAKKINRDIRHGTVTPSEVLG